MQFFKKEEKTTVVKVKVGLGQPKSTVPLPSPLVVTDSSFRPSTPRAHVPAGLANLHHAVKVGPSAREPFVQTPEMIAELKLAMAREAVRDITQPIEPEKSLPFEQPVTPCVVPATTHEEPPSQPFSLPKIMSTSKQLIKTVVIKEGQSVKNAIVQKPIILKPPSVIATNLPKAPTVKLSKQTISIERDVKTSSSASTVIPARVESVEHPLDPIDITALSLPGWEHPSVLGDVALFCQPLGEIGYLDGQCVRSVLAVRMRWSSGAENVTYLFSYEKENVILYLPEFSLLVAGSCRGTLEVFARPIIWPVWSSSCLAVKAVEESSDYHIGPIVSLLEAGRSDRLYSLDSFGVVCLWEVQIGGSLTLLKCFNTGLCLSHGIFESGRLKIVSKGEYYQVKIGSGTIEKIDSDTLAFRESKQIIPNFSRAFFGSLLYAN